MHTSRGCQTERLNFEGYALEGTVRGPSSRRSAPYKSSSGRSSRIAGIASSCDRSRVADGLPGPLRKHPAYYTRVLIKHRASNKVAVF